MYKFLIALLFLISCTTTRPANSTNNLTEEQVFIASERMGKPGKCYTKVKIGEAFKWAEVICPNSVTKSMIKEIQQNLQRLNFEISEEEIEKSHFGTTSKAAFKQFQMNNNLAYGGLDWASINRLKKAN